MVNKTQLELLQALKPHYGDGKYYMPTQNGTKKFRTKTIDSMVKKGWIEVNQYNNYRLSDAGFKALELMKEEDND